MTARIDRLGGLQSFFGVVAATLLASTAVADDLRQRTYQLVKLDESDVDCVSLGMSTLNIALWDGELATPGGCRRHENLGSTSFDCNWQASEPLDVLITIYDVPGRDRVSGQLSSRDLEGCWERFELIDLR